MPTDPVSASPRQTFPLSRWSVVEAACSRQAEQRQRALDVLISAYWKPVYKYIRLRWEKDRERAQDLTQEFFLRIVEKRLLDRYDPARARLRTYLRTCVDGLVMNEDKAAQRLKRGGNAKLLPLDFESADGELQQWQIRGSDTPEDLFSQEFVRSLFSLAIKKLRAECEARDKSVHFQLLELYDIEEGGKEYTYADVARRFNLKATDVTNYLAYARRELRRIVLEELRRMTATEEEFRREAQTLLGLEMQ